MLQLEQLREEHALLVEKRAKFEAEYRDKAAVFLRDRDIFDKIENARAEVQTNKYLQAIHEAHVAVLKSRKAIADMEGELCGEDTYTVTTTTLILISCARPCKRVKDTSERSV